MSAEDAAANAASSIISPEMLQSEGGKKVFGENDEEIADMNLKLQQVLMDKVRRVRFASDRRVGGLAVCNAATRVRFPATALPDRSLFAFAVLVHTLYNNPSHECWKYATRA